jgi:hypothetical protein
MAVALQDIEGDSAAVERIVRKLIADHAGFASAVFFWGYTADFGGNCCDPSMDMHKRYTDWLPKLARELRRQGIEVGYYTNPSYSPNPQWGHWIEKNDADYGASVHYVDAIASCTPDQLLDVDIDPGVALIEWPTYALPSFATLASGCFWHGPSYPDGAPYKTSDEPRITSWCEMGRHLFPTEHMYHGPQNGDWWNSPAEPHIFEAAGPRLAFRLGMGLCIQPQRPDWAVNECVIDILTAYYRSRFFSRGPFYRGQTGLEYDRERMHVTRFTMQDGSTVLLVDRWDDPEVIASMHLPAMMAVDGQTILLPYARIAVVEVPS